MSDRIPPIARVRLAALAAAAPCGCRSSSSWPARGGHRPAGCWSAGHRRPGSRSPAWAALLVLGGAGRRARPAQRPARRRGGGGLPRLARRRADLPARPGPVTRVRLRGENASRLRAAPAPAGLGGSAPARLRGEEHDRGRPPGADRDRDPASRPSAAGWRSPPPRGASCSTRCPAPRGARQRLEDAGARRPPPGSRSRPTPVAARSQVEPALDDRIERAAARGARWPRSARLRPRRAAEAEHAGRRGGRSRRRRPQPRRSAPRPAPTATAPADGRAWRSRRRDRRWRCVVLPLVGAGAAWGAGCPGSTGCRSRAPISAGSPSLAPRARRSGDHRSGAIMARAWWPRLVGVVVAGGLAAAVFVGRALIGG